MSTDKEIRAARTKNEKILALARKRFKLCVASEEKLRERQLEDKKFAGGKHWPEKVEADRKSDGRPVLVIDRLTPQLKQVTNQQRQMRPAVQVNPVSDGAAQDVAEVLQGIIRHIETQSDADDAYDQAGRDQVEIGIGWWRVITQYVDDDSGNQEIRIERVRNPFKIWADPTAVRRDRADMMYAFDVSDLLEEELEEKYPDATHTTIEEFRSGIGDDEPQWYTGERIRVAKYWTVETTTTQVKLATGKTRDKITRKVVCYVITGLEVLKTYEWAGKWIPLVPVLGDETEIEGEVDLRGMVRGAKDPQQMLNFQKSAVAEALALAPKAPFIAAEGQLEGREKIWRDANKKNYAVLTYKPTTLAGEQVPPPARQAVETPIQALMAATTAAENDLRAATGFFDVGDQEQPEASGVAINARMQMGQHGNSDYLDGLARAIRQNGRILIDLIPKIYDVPRVLRILGTDQKPKTVMVHAGNAPQPAINPQTGQPIMQPVTDPNTGQPAIDPQSGQPQMQPQMQPAIPPGVSGVYDIGVGEYDVAVTQGPSLQSARAQFLQDIAPILQSQPTLFMAIGDLIFEEMDIPKAKELADRVRAMQDPRLHGGDAAMQAATQPLQNQIQVLQQKLAEATQTINSKQIETQSAERIKAADVESKQQIAAIQADVEKFKAQQSLAIESMRTDRAVGVEKLKAEHTGALQSTEHAHEHAIVTRNAINTEAAAQRREARQNLATEHGGEQPKAA